MTEIANRKKTLEELEREIEGLRERHRRSVNDWLQTRFEANKRERQAQLNASFGLTFSPQAQSRSK
jgi:hypothetical protein